jgi:hypothetical protein
MDNKQAHAFAKHLNKARIRALADEGVHIDGLDEMLEVVSGSYSGSDAETLVHAWWVAGGDVLEAYEAYIRGRLFAHKGGN